VGIRQNGTFTVFGGTASDVFFALQPDWNQTLNLTFHGGGSSGIVTFTANDQINFANFNAANILLANNTRSGIFFRTGSSPDGTPWTSQVVGGGTLIVTYDNIEAVEGTSGDDILVSHMDATGENSGDHQLSGDPTTGEDPNRSAGGDDHLFGAGHTVSVVNGQLVYEFDTTYVARIVAREDAYGNGYTSPAADNFIPGGGIDTIYFGANVNWVDYEDARSEVTVWLDEASQSENRGEWATGDRYLNRLPSMRVNLTGSRYSDFLNGDEGGNTIIGGGWDVSLGFTDFGNDQISGHEGDDEIYGVYGNDSLYGGSGADYLSGDVGDDIVQGDAGADVLVGGAGADRFVYSSYADSNLSGGADTLRDFNGSQGDRLDLSVLANLSGLSVNTNGAGTLIFASDGSGGTFAIASDTVIQAADILLHSNITSVIVNGNGNANILTGSSTGDLISGGGGGDSMTGGGGDDRFVWHSLGETAYAAADNIWDFAQGQDVLDFGSLGLDRSEVNWAYDSQSNVTIIFIDDNNNGVDSAIILHGVSTLSWNDFIGI